MEEKLKKMWNKLPIKTKLIIIGAVAGTLFTVLFIVILISPLINLGIIDMDEGSSGLSYSSNTYLKEVQTNTETIIVDDESISLEDHTARVLSYYIEQDVQNNQILKAKSVAIRSYIITKTNQGQKSISSVDLPYSTEINTTAQNIVNETAGLVLTKNGYIFASNPNNLDVTNDEGKTIDDLVSEGYDYKDLLSYYYENTVIKNMLATGGYTNGLAASANNFTKRTTMPVEGNEYDNKFFYSNDNYSYSAGYVGQCTWYAFGRANEILNQAGSDLKWVYAPDAKYWLQYNLYLREKAFSYSTNVEDPKVGAIIVWTNDQFGHVAVVEAVNANGTIDYSEANISSAKNSNNPYGFRYQSNVSYTGTEVGTISRIWNGYSFAGYIYMVE